MSEDGNDVAIEDVRAIAVALGLGGHARAYSAHEVVQREILPGLALLLAELQRFRQRHNHTRFTNDGGVTWSTCPASCPVAST